MAAWTALQFYLDAATPYANGLPWASFVRATAPAASGSALFLSLVLWAHPLALPALQADLKRILTRALLVAIPGYALAAGISLAVAYALLRVLASAGFAPLLPRDFLVGAVAALVDAALCVFLASRFLARLRAARLSLPTTLVIVLTATVPLRAMIGLILASWLPA